MFLTFVDSSITAFNFWQNIVQCNQLFRNTLAMVFQVIVKDFISKLYVLESVFYYLYILFYNFCYFVVEGNLSDKIAKNSTIIKLFFFIL